MGFGRRRIDRRAMRPEPVGPLYLAGDIIGFFEIVHYMGHSDVNKRNNRIMSKPQHWYHCVCDCGLNERRSQQELTDQRRQQCCAACRKKGRGQVNEDQSQPERDISSPA
jgi:hypothetical protein